MNRHNIANQLEKKQWIAEWLLYIFAAECVFGGSGRWLCIGSLSIRILLFALCFLATLPFVFLKRKQLLRNPCIVITIVFAIVVFVCLCIGIRNGNAFGFIWADASSFLALSLLPGMFAVIDKKEKLMRLLNIIFYTSVCVAAVTMILHIGLAFMSDAATIAINDWINDRNLGGFTMLATGLNRVYFRAQIFLQFSAFYGAWKIWVSSKRRDRIALFICEGVMLFAIVVSYTRGFWIGLVCAAVIVLVLEWKHWKKLFCTAGISLIIVAILSGISTLCYGQPYLFIEIVNRFDSNLIVLSADDEEKVAIPAPAPEQPLPENEAPVKANEECTEEEIDRVAAANEIAVNLRKDSLAAMHEKILQHLVIGNGLGTNLDGVRTDGKTEYMYQDILMKMGVIGLIAFLATYFLYPLLHIVMRLKNSRKLIDVQNEIVRNSFLVAGYLSVAVTSAFNPFLSTPMGILMLGVVNLAVYNKRKTSC
ncbi:MAG: hypothetical protein Q4D42_05765 [Eubacteriales bacterium]|nr:hypothetical protein [Eubacteriales bacterium]